jgi:hypothetical protein
MKKILFLVLLAAESAFFLSCSRLPYSSEINSEQLIDFTQYDQHANFYSYKTYAIVDSVSVIKNGDSTRVKDANSDALISQIKKNMGQLGYQLVNVSGKPDLGINVTVIKTTTNYYYPGWYWGYPGYYPPNYWGYPSYGYWYPYYPTYVYSSSTGTVILDMLDLKNAASNDNKIFIVWTAYIRALLDANVTMQEINDNVDQCFSQTKPFQSMILR